MGIPHTNQTDRLISAILALRTQEECYCFFEDLCTVKEVLSLAQRLEVAHQLSTGKKYGEVSAAVGASPATISRVNRSLQYGSGGYTLVLDRMPDDKEEP